MSMIPLNFKSLITTMTGKSNSYQVGNDGTVYTQCKRVIFSGTRLSSYPAGQYDAGDDSKHLMNDSDMITHLFAKKEACSINLSLKSKWLTQLYGEIKEWKARSGKNAKQVVVEFLNNPDSDQMVICVSGAGIPGEFFNLDLSMVAGPAQGDKNVTFRFNITELLVFLYPFSQFKNDDNLEVVLSYQPDTFPENASPLFLSFKALGESFCIGHQVCEILEEDHDQGSESKPKAGAKDESFLDESGAPRSDLLEDEDPGEEADSEDPLDWDDEEQEEDQPEYEEQPTENKVVNFELGKKPKSKKVKSAKSETPGSAS